MTTMGHPTQNEHMLYKDQKGDDLLGPLAKSSPQLLSDCSTNNPVSVGRVFQTYWHYSLAWYELASSHWRDNHKSSSRLYFLETLKKSGLQSHQLRHLRPILEYCSPITVSPRPRSSHWKPFNATHSESLIHLQSACLTRSHLAAPSSDPWPPRTLRPKYFFLLP